MNNSVLSEQTDITILLEIFAHYQQVKEVVLYGSRAKETHHSRSDFDIVIRNSNLDRRTLAMLRMDINESNFPFTVDMQEFEQINNQQLITHILRVGKVIYERQ